MRFFARSLDRLPQEHFKIVLGEWKDNPGIVPIRNVPDMLDVRLFNLLTSERDDAEMA